MMLNGKTYEAKSIDVYIDPHEEVEVIGFRQLHRRGKTPLTFRRRGGITERSFPNIDTNGQRQTQIPNNAYGKYRTHHRGRRSCHRTTLAAFLFRPCRTVVRGTAVGCKDIAPAAYTDALAQGSATLIVNEMITGTKAGLHLNPNELEAHYLAKGNVPNVIQALVSAQKANINLDFKMASAIDTAGRNVFEAVQMSVNPKVINTPPVSAVAKNGIQLIAKARVTVRANIKQLVGGAGEETVLARVGEGIVFFG